MLEELPFVGTELMPLLGPGTSFPASAAVSGGLGVASAPAVIVTNATKNRLLNKRLDLKRRV